MTAAAGASGGMALRGVGLTGASGGMARRGVGVPGACMAWCGIVWQWGEHVWRGVAWRAC
eukprot:250526-Chlamydomonas_euryale.AAC.4